ncbi:hypothetical protein ACH5RR_033349 [Cinchona calisaya]|uniref:Uncharacterized protein n=1 Tax=Cinchona calisaya TaxID=153742 RepID=A0ABD2YNU3_9GENT
MDGGKEQQLEEQVSENMDSQHAETRKKANNTQPISYLDEAAKKENLRSLPSASVHLLKKFFESKPVRKQSTNAPSSTSSSSSKELSTNDILKTARERLLQHNTQNLDMISLAVGGLFAADSGLPSEKNEDLKLAILLQAAVLKFSNQQFDDARKLLSLCQTFASITGNALQRVVCYFSAALQGRIFRDIGELAPEAPAEGNQSMPTLEEALTSFQPVVAVCQQEFPICQVAQFTAIQAIVDNVATAKRVHIVDLGIKSGSHWPIIMQALAGRHECRLELLKITAVGTPKERIEETGKKLSSFAETMSIPFAFRLIVSDMKDLEEDFFELAADEVLAVYSDMRLASLLSSPDHLESLMRTITKLNPCVLVITEIEANTNAPTFLDRFDAALSISAAVFDCIEDCMDQENPGRALMGVFFWEMIQNIITTEGEERIHRYEKLDFWRAFLTRFGIVEIAMSDLALCQLQLVVKTNPRWCSCTVELNGKGLIIGWNGTPIKSLSVWKSQQDDG